MKNGQLKNEVFKRLKGKVPPQFVPLEEALLGACLIDKFAFHQMVNLGVNKKTFYFDSHQLIFLAMVRLNDQGLPIDLLTVTAEMQKMGLFFAGQVDEKLSPYYLVELTNKVASSANLAGHCLKLREYELKREIIDHSYLMIDRAYEESADALELLEDFQKAAFALGDLGTVSKESDGLELYELSEKAFHNARKPESEAFRLMLGFNGLDQLIGQLKEGDFGLVAARPGVGKSGFMAKAADHIARTLAVPVGIITLEMTKLQQYWRICSRVSGVSIHKISNAFKLSEPEANQFLESSKIVRDLPILYYDGVGRLDQVCSKIRSMAARGCKVIFIDYIQLMNAPGYATRDLELGTISRTLKELAKELGISIIGLSQLKRGTGRPKLSELRESGNLEQDIDFCVLLYRPILDGITHDEQGALPKGYTEAILAKNRNGALDTVVLYFTGFNASFDNYEGETKEFEDIPF